MPYFGSSLICRCVSSILQEGISDYSKIRSKIYQTGNHLIYRCSELFIFIHFLLDFSAMATALERLKKGRWLFIQRLLFIDCLGKTHFLYTSLSTWKDVNKVFAFAQRLQPCQPKKGRVAKWYSCANERRRR